jgi:putative transposase
VIVEADGGPLGVVVAGANVHDTKLLQQTIEAIVVDRPKPTDKVPQHLCLDKGYDNPTGHLAAAQAHYVPHIRRIGEEKLDERGRKRRPARRWVWLIPRK